MKYVFFIIGEQTFNGTMEQFLAAGYTEDMINEQIPLLSDNVTHDEDFMVDGGFGFQDY